jgi:hypothetical protein
VLFREERKSMVKGKKVNGTKRSRSKTVRHTVKGAVKQM